MKIDSLIVEQNTFKYQYTNYVINWFYYATNHFLVSQYFDKCLQATIIITTIYQIDFTLSFFKRKNSSAYSINCIIIIN